MIFTTAANSKENMTPPREAVRKDGSILRTTGGSCVFIIVIRRSTVLRKCEALSPPACVDPPLENHTDFRAQKVLNVGLLFLNPALLKPFIAYLDYYGSLEASKLVLVRIFDLLIVRLMILRVPEGREEYKRGKKHTCQSY